MSSSDRVSLFPVTFDDQKLAKELLVVGEDARKCLVCDQPFRRQQSFEHSESVGGDGQALRQTI